MIELRVSLFGGFEVRGPTGPSIVIPTRKARALFALLARHPGQDLSRETLATMLWPESAESDSRGNLRQSLKLVRRALKTRGDSFITSNGDALALASDAVEVDVAVFDGLYPADTPEALGRAGAIYRGDFLEGANLADGPFANWAMIERTQLRERALDVFGRLLDGHVAADETGAHPASANSSKARSRFLRGQPMPSVEGAQCGTGLVLLVLLQITAFLTP